MSKHRLQVLVDEDEFQAIRSIAERRRMTVSEWVRTVLREAREGQPAMPVGARLAALREASTFEYPSGDIEQMLEEIGRGYLAADTDG